MDLLYNVIALGCLCYCGWLLLRWTFAYLITTVRKRSNAVDEEDDILLTHEADPYLAVLDEEHAQDWAAWADELTAKARRLAEKLDGAG